MSQQRLSVREAAEILGISPDGVRMRIKRGSMESERDDEGRVWVWLETANSASQDPYSGYQQSSGEIEALRDEVANLRSIISQRDSELERAHRLLGESLQQLRGLNAPGDTTEEDSQQQEESQDSDTSTGEVSVQESNGLQNRLFDIAVGGALSQAIITAGSWLIPLVAGAVVAAVSAINGEFFITLTSSFLGALVALLGFFTSTRLNQRQTARELDSVIASMNEQFERGMSEGEKAQARADEDFIEKVRKHRERQEGGQESPQSPPANPEGETPRSKP